jgi:hypothetical protein
VPVTVASVPAPAGRRLAPAGLALLAFVVAMVLTGWNAWEQTGGHFAYAQDDPYIHLTLARTLASHGVWGVTPDSPAAASSSPAWTLLLALLQRAGGDHVWWPFVINVIAACGVILLVDRFLPVTLSEPSRAAALLAIVFVLPLPTLVFIGMEHTLHIACVVALTSSAARRLSDERPDAIWGGGALLAAAVAALRYEGLFVVAVVALLAWIRGRRVLALTLVIAAAVPLMAYAAYATAQGSWILPNSVVIKSGPTRFGSPSAIVRLLGSWTGLFSLYQRPPQLALVLAASALTAVAAGRGSGRWTSPHLLVAMFLGVETLHVCLINIEWFYRYEAYAVALGSMAVVAVLAELSAAGWFAAQRRDATQVRRAAVGVFVVVVSLPLFLRGAFALSSTPTACGEIYRQQVQMGRFFREFYAGDTIALNDIGAVSWMAPVRVVDLIGLASNEVAHARRAGLVDASYIREFVSRRDVTAAAIYESHFRAVRELPAEWVKVGEWSMPSVLAVGGDTVAFFAPAPAHVARLRRSLDAFARELPDGVTYVRTDAD